MDAQIAKQLLRKLLDQVTDSSNRAAVDRFPSLRDVDSKARESKLLISGVPGIPPKLVEQMETDVDFEANSRRVRLEAIANYCANALTFLDSGVYQPDDRPIFPAPDLTSLTASMPGLDECLRSRWEESQRNMHSKCFLSAVILMGSIIEGLLLARISRDQAIACRSAKAPRDRLSNVLPVHDWKLAAMIEVAADVGWIKFDRAKFSLALRESRNIVHPYAQVTSHANFDEGTSKTCWQVINAAVDDLIASVV
jgi:hypothetical protein